MGANARMQHYSWLSLARAAIQGQDYWKPAWRDCEPKQGYDVVIVGGGGHGLATAYYLARQRPDLSIAVLERGWIGGGNTARNTTIVRSNYRLRPNQDLYEFSLRMWEGLSAELNFNVMFSQRGILNLAHSDAEMSQYVERGNAMRLAGIDAEVLNPAQLHRHVPSLDLSSGARFPIKGALLQRRAGVARHDAIAWGYARAASALGVDIVQNCEVTGLTIQGGRVRGVRSSRGEIGAQRVGAVVAANTTQVCEMAGISAPIETHILQAMVSEPVKPFLHTIVRSGVVHCYISQTDKGEVLIGGDLDGYPNFSNRGAVWPLMQVAGEAISLLPALANLRLMRSWAGAVDMTMDGSPIISETPVDGFYLNGGWCYGGFKATPASGFVFAHLLATGMSHPLGTPFSLARFERGELIDESGNGANPRAQ